MPDAHFDKLCLFSDAQTEIVGNPKHEIKTLIKVNNVVPKTEAKYFEGLELCLKEIILNFDINFQFYHCNSIHIRILSK